MNWSSVNIFERLLGVVILILGLACMVSCVEGVSAKNSGVDSVPSEAKQIATTNSSNVVVDEKWALDVPLDEDIAELFPKRIKVKDDESIDVELLAKLKKQAEDQFNILKTYDMEAMEAFAPSYEMFHNEYIEFFTFKDLFVAFPFFKRFFDQHDWEVPKDIPSIYKQYHQTSTRAPFVRIHSQFGTFNNKLLRSEDVVLKDVIVNKSELGKSLYDITLLISTDDRRTYVIRNRACYYKKSVGCFNYLSWSYLGRLVNGTNGRLFNVQDHNSDIRLDK